MDPDTLYFLLKAFFASAELAGCCLAFLLNLDVDDTKERWRIVIIGGGIVIPSILILIFGVWWGLLVTPVYAYICSVLYGVWLKDHFGAVDRLCSQGYKSLFMHAEPPKPEPPPPPPVELPPERKSYASRIGSEPVDPVPPYFGKAPVRPVDPAVLSAALTDELLKRNIALPDREIFAVMVSVGTELYDQAQPWTLPAEVRRERPVGSEDLNAWDAWASEWFDAPRYAQAAIVEALVSYAAYLPKAVSAPFRAPIVEFVDPSSFMWDLIEPFRSKALKERGIFAELRETFNKNAGALGGDGDAVFPNKYAGPKAL